MQEIIQRTEQTYPFRFFCEEHLSVAEVCAEVQLCYEEAVRQHGSKEPPCMGTMKSLGMDWFIQEQYVRIALRQDYDGGELGEGFAEDVCEHYREWAGTMEEFVYWCRCTYNFLTADREYQHNFGLDLKAALNMMGYVYFDHDLDRDGYLYYHYRDTKKYHKPLRELLVNPPTVGVW